MATSGAFPISDTTQIILTCYPSFTDLALDELEQVGEEPAVVSELAPGIIMVGGAESFHELAPAWRKAPPIFIRHVCPVHAVIALPSAEIDVQVLEQYFVSELASSVDGNRTFSVQCRIVSSNKSRPFDVNSHLSGVVQALTGAQLDVRRPEQVLSVVCAAARSTARSSVGATPLGEDDGPPTVVYMGLSLAGDNISDWAGGARRYAREPGQISRAEFKLLEALEVFDIQLPARGVALDLGAAPGGWTRVLRLRDQYVTAVDPGDLHADLLADRYVRHRCMTAEQYLEDDPDQYDVIVNDMRMDGRDSARAMVKYAHLLYRDGIALMTLKLPARNRKGIIDHAFSILGERYQIAGAKQLFHNRSEVTLYLKRN